MERGLFCPGFEEDGDVLGLEGRQSEGSHFHVSILIITLDE